MPPRTDIVSLEPFDPESTAEPLAIPLDQAIEEGEPVVEFEFGEDDEESIAPPAPQASHQDNLAEVIAREEGGEAILENLSSNLVESFDADNDSREDWDAIVSQAIGLLGFKIETKDRPFRGACGASHPVLSQAVVKFQAKAFRELYPSQGPARTRVVGAVTPEKERQALRVKEFLNYQTTQLMPEYGPQLDKLLFNTALMGSSFKKTYWDVALNRPASRLVSAKDFVIDYYADDLETAERYTHIMRMSANEIKRWQLAGAYRVVELDDPEEPEITEEEETIDEFQGKTRPPTNYTNDVYTLYEMHINLDLPGFEEPNGLMLPYIVTLEKDSGEILRILRNWEEGDETYQKKVYFTHYCFVPGLGFYGYGYLHLIGGLAKTATSTLQQLTDAGTFANLPAGFKAHGLRVLAPDDPLQPGEWREANAPAGDLSKSLVPLPYKEPSRTLYELMQFMVETAKEFADQTDVVVSESSNYGPVGTTLALLEQSGKLFSAIHQRMHTAQGHDLKLLAELNFKYMPESYPYEVTGGDQEVFRTDFDAKTIDVIPVSDPNMPTEAHRVAKLNAIMTVASQDPAAHNMNAIRLDLYRAMGVEQPERYMAQQTQPFTGDPVSENSAAMIGTPLAVAPAQNDDAHMVVHAMVLQNPAYQENQGLKQILLSHINDHMASKQRKEFIDMISRQDPQAAQALMQPAPQAQPDQQGQQGQQDQQQPTPQIPPQVEQAIAIAAMNVSDAVLKIDIAKAEALAGKSPDPMIKLQERELVLQAEKQDKDYDLALSEQIMKNIRDQQDQKLKKGDQSLEEAGMMIDDVNADEDRAMKKEIELIKQKGKSDGS